MKKLICSLIVCLCCFSCFSNTIFKGGISGFAFLFQNDYDSSNQIQPSKFDFEFCPITGVDLSVLWESNSDELTSIKMIYGLSFGYEVMAFYLDGVIGFNKILTQFNNYNLELSVASSIGPAMGLFYGMMFFNFGIEGNLYFVPKNREGFFWGIGVSDKDLLRFYFYENDNYNMVNFNMIRINLSCGLRI